jgi:hypothetical protein
MENKWTDVFSQQKAELLQPCSRRLGDFGTVAEELIERRPVRERVKFAPQLLKPACLAQT